MIVFAQHQSVLQKLGLSTLEEVRAFQGEVIKSHGNRRRDILRICTTDEAGAPLVLFLKRSWHPYKKDGLRTLLCHGQVWSISRQEWENSLSLQHAGLKTAPLVAFGEDCGRLWERFSFLITEAVASKETLQHFLKSCREPCRRRLVLDALAREVHRMHEAGLAMPDLYTRHVFVDATAEQPVLHLIDMARLDRRVRLSQSLRARDLAALNVTAPLCDVSPRERIRFLRVYGKRIDRKLVGRIATRMKHLLLRRKHADFQRPVGKNQLAEIAR
ncbi:MAG: hypothetical protein IPK15_01415 [Verrucomicrobia bacterium]|nr:hypothetical protein [Verrucomicrobiota bacterium]